MLNTTQEIKPQTWETGVLVPLAQNFGGGLASALFVAVIAYAWNRANGLQTDIEPVSVWSSVIGAIVATGWTIVRFFGDEIGLIRAAYQAGAASRDDEIARLNRQINSLQAETAAEPEADKQTLLGRMRADHENAKLLLKVALGRGNIARDSEDHKLTKRPWGRAIWLLIHAKVIEEGSNKLLVASRVEASETLATYFAEQYQNAQGGKEYQPAWWGTTKS